VSLSTYYYSSTTPSPNYSGFPVSHYIGEQWGHLYLDFQSVFSPLYCIILNTTTTTATMVKLTEVEDEHFSTDKPIPSKNDVLLASEDDDDEFTDTGEWRLSVGWLYTLGTLWDSSRISLDWTGLDQPVWRSNRNINRQSYHIISYHITPSFKGIQRLTTHDFWH